MKIFKYLSIIIILMAFMFGQVTHKSQRDAHLHMPFMTWGTTPESNLEGDINDFCMDTVNAVLYWKATGEGTTTGWVVFTPTAIADADYGEITVASGVWTIDDDVIGDEHFKNDDWGDITISSGVASVEDDSHNHIYSNIDAFTEANLYTILSDVTNFLQTGDALAGDDITDGTVDATELGVDAVSASELNATGVESELEAVMDLQDMQGAVIDGQVPNNISIDLAATVTTNANLTGDVTSVGNATTIGADKILESMLKAVNVAVDEDILTRESTTGDFEWHTPSELGITATVDIDTFSELQAIVADKTLVNEEDVFAIDANWVNTANPWAVNEVDASLLTATEGDAAYQPLEATLTDIADGTINENLVNTAFPWAANEITEADPLALLTAGTDNIKDTHPDWGTGAGQISAVDLIIADVGVIITATEVEGALQENRTAIDLNTAKVTNTDDQTIDVFSVSGDNVQLSLESDGEATKTVDISTTTAVTANTAKITDDDDGVAEVYGESTWNADTEAPTKNDVRDKVETMQGLIDASTTHLSSDGSDHTFIDIDVTSGSSPTFDAANITEIPFTNLDTDFGELIDSHSGLAWDKPVFTVVDATGLKLDIEKDGGGDIDFFINGVKSTLDCTTGAGAGGKARVSLTAGADANNPATNYIYVTDSGGTATLVANVSKPTGAFAWIGKVIVPDATTWATTGEYLIQRFTEAFINDSRGTQSHAREKLRVLGAVYDDVGLTHTLNIDAAGALPDTVHLAVATGEIYQLHRQTFPTINEGAYYYGNGTNQYEQIEDLGDILELVDGSAIVNNQRYNLVVWGAQNYSSGDCKLYVNVPNAIYLNDAQADADINNTSIYSVPVNFRSVAFLIARITLKYTTGSGGTFVEINTHSLLGNPVGYSAGGAGAVASNEFQDSQFLIFDNADATKELQFQLSTITTGNTRVVTVPDKDGTMAMVSDIGSPALSTRLDGVEISAVPSDYDFETDDFDVTDATKADSVNIAIDASITRDVEWDTASEINAATTDEDFLVESTTFAGDVDGAYGTLDIDEVAVETELESVLDLQDLQGAVTDGQVPDDIAITEADPNVDTADEIEAILTNDPMDFGTGSVGANGFDASDANITNVGRVEADVIASDANVMLTVEDSTNFSDDVNIAGTLDVVGSVISSSVDANNANFIGSATGTGDVLIWLDASDGDLSGGDYALIKQDNDLDLYIINEDSADDIYIDSGDDILFQSDGSTKMTFDGANGYLGIGTTTPISALEVEDGLTTIGALFTLGTKETTVVDGDKLGQINFYAPLEADGTDAILVGASIWAEADATFGIADNSTELVFATGASEVATEKMRIDHDGNVGIGISTPASILSVKGDLFSTAQDSKTGIWLNNISMADGDDNYGVGIEFSTISGARKKAAIVPVQTSADENSLGLDFFVGNGVSTSAAFQMMRIEHTGVGIGTTSPDKLLHLKSTVPSIQFEDTDSAVKWHIEQNADDFVIVESGVATRMEIEDGGLATFTNSVKANDNYVMEGYATGRNVLRSLRIVISNATTAGNYVKVSATDQWNASAITEEDDLLLGTTGTNFFYGGAVSYSYLLYILSTGFDGNVVGVLSADIKSNASGVPLSIEFIHSSNGIKLTFRHSSTAVLQDLDLLLDTGDISIVVTYVTST